MNKVILIGRAAKDFELRYTPSGHAVANGTIAVDRPFQKGETDFINLVAWRQTAELAANYIRKGNRFAVEGYIQVRSYERDGQKRFVTEIVFDRLEFLESKNGDNSGQTNRQSSSDPFVDDGQPINISSDDLPF